MASSRRKRGPYNKVDPVIRFSRFLRVASNGCIEWTGAVNNKGYGVFSVYGKPTYAHIFAYKEFVGDIHPNREIDHICRNRRCVNVAHLECVTAAVNVSRSMHPTAIMLRAGVCKRGHAFVGANIGTRTNGKRYCIACYKYRYSKEYSHGKQMPIV